MTMFLSALFGASVICFLIVRYADLHVAFTGDYPDNQPQKFHSAAVPRIGGLAVVIGLLVAGGAGYARGFVTAGFYWAMLAVLLPAFVGGFAEDLTRKVRPAIRLGFTAVAAAIAFVWFEANLYRSDVAWLDYVFSYWPISFAATLFAVAGVAHAMNIIDGYNGLSAGVGVLALLGLGAVSYEIGDLQIALISFGAAGAYAGFLLFNYPFGRIFLGDGGAYLLGTIIAILSARLVGRHSDVSPWFPLVLVIYPVWETLFSALRRLLLHRTHIGQPDARHLHSLIYRRVMRVFLPKTDDASLAARNALTTLPLWLVQAGLVGSAVVFYDSTGELVLISAGFLVSYGLAYLWLGRIKRPIPKRVENYLARRREREQDEVTASVS